MVLLASAFDQSRFLRAEDVRQEKTLRIKKVTEESVGQGVDQQKKLVVWFINDERGLVLNRVNNRTIRGAFGDEVDGWPGKIIVVFPTETEFRGRMTAALRVRIPPPKHSEEETGRGRRLKSVENEEELVHGRDRRLKSAPKPPEETDPFNNEIPPL